MNEWLNVPVNYKDYLGFVYKIVHLPTGRYYIGQKTFWFSDNKKLARKPTKLERERLERYKLKNKLKYDSYKKDLKLKYTGLKKKVCGIKESDWKEYWGSSKELLELIAKEGEDNFTRTILSLHKSKSSLSYEELVQQINYDVLRDSLSFNGMINVRLSKIKK